MARRPSGPAYERYKAAGSPRRGPVYYRYRLESGAERGFSVPQARGHAEEAGQLPVSRTLFIDDLRGARSIYLPAPTKQPPDRKGRPRPDRQVVIWEDAKGKLRRKYLPPGTDKEALVDELADRDYPEPEDT